MCFYIFDPKVTWSCVMRHVCVIRIPFWVYCLDAFFYWLSALYLQLENGYGSFFVWIILLLIFCNKLSGKDLQELFRISNLTIVSKNCFWKTFFDNDLWKLFGIVDLLIVCKNNLQLSYYSFGEFEFAMNFLTVCD